MALNVRIVRKFVFRETGVIVELHDDYGYIRAVENGEEHRVLFHTTDAVSKLKVISIMILIIFIDEWSFLILLQTNSIYNNTQSITNLLSRFIRIPYRFLLVSNRVITVSFSVYLVFCLKLELKGDIPIQVRNSNFVY